MAEGTNGRVSVTYRGEENIWGNIWNWLEGINVNRNSSKHVHEIYYADHGYKDDTGNDLGTKKFNVYLSQKPRGTLALLLMDLMEEWTLCLLLRKLKEQITGA